MNWVGKWKNQYGSILDITIQEDNKLEGTLEPGEHELSGGQKLSLVGVWENNHIAVTCRQEGKHVITYAGMLYEGKMEATWFMVNGGVAWREAIRTSVD